MVVFYVFFDIFPSWDWLCIMGLKYAIWMPTPYPFPPFLFFLQFACSAHKTTQHRRPEHRTAKDPVRFAISMKPSSTSARLCLLCEKEMLCRSYEDTLDFTKPATAVYQAVSFEAFPNGLAPIYWQVWPCFEPAITPYTLTQDFSVLLAFQG